MFNLKLINITNHNQQKSRKLNFMKVIVKNQAVSFN